MIVVVPHRDYYERKMQLPSIYNGSHFHFFLPFEKDPPDTLCFYDLLRANTPGGSVRYINECSDSMPVHRACKLVGGRQDPAEWSIEAVVQKCYLTPMFERNYEQNTV